MMTAIDALARHVAGTPYEDLPDAATKATRKFILDTIGVGLLGSAGPWVEELIAAQGAQPATGGVRVLGRPVRLGMSSAALCNAYQMHNCEFDCVHEGAVVHAVTCVLAVSLAEIDRLHFESGTPVHGTRLIQAVTLGVDVACTLGVACSSGLRFFRPGTCGAFGATAALAVLRDFDPERLVSAFGIVHGQLCGTMQAHTEGSPLLGMQMGFSARNAVLACDLAGLGVPGPRDVLEGPFGYFALFEGAHDLDRVIPDLGRIWRITEIAHKPFPSGRATHGIVDACLALRREYSVDESKVSRVTARVPPLINHLVGRPVTDNMDINYARLCACFAAARVLISGNLVYEDFSESGRQDPDTLSVARRVHIEVDDNPDPNALTPLSVEIECHDGACFRKRIDTVYGHPANPLTRDAWLDKFRDNWRLAASPLDPAALKRVIERLENLHEISDSAVIIDDLVP